MAARENQGLQIAVIVFVIIALALAVTAFMFYSKLEEERSKIAEKVKAAETANKRATEAEDQVKNLGSLVGLAAADKLEDVRKKDFEGRGDVTTYRGLVQQLTKLVGEKELAIKDAEDRVKKLNDKIAADEASKVADFKKYVGEVETAKNDVVDVRTKTTATVNAVEKSKTDLQTQVAATRTKSDAKQKELLAKIQDLEKQIEKLSITNVALKGEIAQNTTDSDLPDGNISWVNQSEKLTWLNLGSDDGLRQQVTFKVVSADEPNPNVAKAKATVEVVRVTDRHISEARIVDDNPGDPILPGDIVFSTAWQPGRVEHFALARFMDIDGDSVSDRELIKRLITLNGGVVDCELTDEGKLIGELTVETKFLIMGSPATDKATPEFLKNLAKLMESAEPLAIKQMPVPKFLDYIGYRPEQRTVALGKGSRPDDFKPPVPEVPRKTIGKTIDFTPIRPPRKNTAY